VKIYTKKQLKKLDALALKIVTGKEDPDPKFKPTRNLKHMVQLDDSIKQTFGMCLRVERIWKYKEPVWFWTAGYMPRYEGAEMSADARQKRLRGLVRLYWCT